MEKEHVELSITVETEHPHSELCNMLKEKMRQLGYTGTCSEEKDELEYKHFKYYYNGTKKGPLREPYHILKQLSKKYNARVAYQLKKHICYPLVEIPPVRVDYDEVKARLDRMIEEYREKYNKKECLTKSYGYDIINYDDYKIIRKCVLDTCDSAIVCAEYDTTGEYSYRVEYIDRW